MTDFAPKADISDKNIIIEAFKSRAFDHFYISSDVNRVYQKLRLTTQWEDDIIWDVINSFAELLGVELTGSKLSEQDTQNNFTHIENSQVKKEYPLTKDAIFEKWCEKLLDTGKSNKLINYKETKSSSLLILKPNLEYIFSIISSGGALSFYDIDNYVADLNKNYQIQLTQEMSPNDILKHINKNIKLQKGEILAYKNSALVSKIIKNLRKISNTNIFEKGVNPLYIVFGFLKWKMEDDIVDSPLVLIPVSIESFGKSGVFKVKQYIDEISTNPTLVYRIESEFGIVFPKFQDDEFENESIDEYFERLNAFAEPFGWKLTKDVVIGVFSFSKLDMYKDLVNNKQNILENKLIDKIFSNSEKDDNDVAYNNNLIDETSLCNVADADSSQINAIAQAKNGVSFVLQGPPGTGKSQTITNLIAEFLKDGKKVLFVSEKRAALNVVYNNLKKAQLADFCLELHSNKANKNDVIEELYRTSTLDTETQEPSKDLQDTFQYTNSKKELDDYKNAIHSDLEALKSTPYQLIGEVEHYNKISGFDFVIDDIQNKDFEYLQKIVGLLEKYSRCTKYIGSDYHCNRWYGYINKNFDFQTKQEIKSLFKNVIGYLANLTAMLKNLYEIYDIKINNFESLDTIKPLLEFLPKIKYFSKKFFISPENKNIYLSIKDFNDESRKIDKATLEICKVFNRDILEVDDIDNCYSRFRDTYSSNFRIFKSKYRHDRKQLLQYRVYKKNNINYLELKEYLRKISDLKKLEQAHKEKEDFLIESAGFEFNSFIEYEWGIIESQLFELLNIIDGDLILSAVDGTEFRKIQSWIVEINKFISENDIDLAITKLRFLFYVNIKDIRKVEFDELINLFNYYYQNFDDEVDNWVRFISVLDELKDENLKDFIDLSISNNVSPLMVSDVYKKIFYTQWLYHTIDNNYVLRNFSRQEHDWQLDVFKRQDTNKFLINKKQINDHLLSSIRNQLNSSDARLLEHEHNKKRRKKSIRRLIYEMPNLIQNLKPCFLMSPLSVSTYLDSDMCKFDVVIFDEASQIFPQDAIGSIYRAKQLIVVGDSKQMPPSDFFTSKTSLDDEDKTEDFDDTVDFESILDLCSISLPHNCLTWHYRSRAEELISFSNSNFYNNDLITFPSLYEGKKGMGVYFHYVENGIFSRKSKSNVIEAKEVIDLIYEHYRQYPERSLGVVAFSESQEEELEELLTKRLSTDDTISKYLDSNAPEPFFIKNLETVQGDERDTIILSIGYATGDDGKLIYNFGPLNKQGGERRLNVAITRAKYNIKVVSSIKSRDLDLSRTTSQGVKLLRDYLDFAEKKTIGAELSNSYVDEKAYFVNEIKDFLCSKDFCVDTFVGCSNFKIDLAVKNPLTNNYCIAIECDGLNYKNAKTTRDRDRLRQEVLERLGWKYYRIWSLDWFKNEKTEKDNLLNFVNDSLKCNLKGS